MTSLVDELHAAVDARPNWHVDDQGVAVYRPAAGVEVWVRPVAKPGPRPRYQFHAALVRDGRVTHAAPCWSAVEAVRWAEQTRAKV